METSNSNLEAYLPIFQQGDFDLESPDEICQWFMEYEQDGDSNINQVCGIGFYDLHEELRAGDKKALRNFFEYGPPIIFWPDASLNSDLINDLESTLASSPKSFI
ncbi:MAG: hypothetical protein AAGG02_01155 [Cyanobacteria bacterium P01_H01_bin.15]